MFKKWFLRSDLFTAIMTSFGAALLIVLLTVFLHILTERPAPIAEAPDLPTSGRASRTLGAEYDGLAEAQQPVNVTRVNSAPPIYDPCLDPTRVLVVNINAGAASGNTELVAISGSTRIWLCSAKIQGGAAGTIEFRFGTGTACATFPTSIDTTSITAAGDGSIITSGGSGSIMRSGTGQALCYVRSASMTAHGHARYVQE